jgi:Plasmid pRiA4b ORF-3-like protein
MPNTMEPSPLPSVYQLRVVVRGVSPLIWRRLLIPADTTIAGLHAVLQIAFGWGGEHLHRFLIHGVEYGIGYAGGVGFRDDPHRVHVAELGLRPTERFVYDYDFTDGWRLDLRLEQILAAGARVYPRCTGGRRAGPPEGCGGVWAFLEQTQPHRVLAAAIRAAEILGMLLDDEDLTRFGEHRDELAGLLTLLGVNQFDRRTLNRALAAHAATETRAA